MRKSEKQDKNRERKGGESKVEFEQDVDALFALTLAEFTGARNALAARLKKSGRSDDATFVKALAKPPISAWAVNQLYWNHRGEFDRLIASGERFHKVQKSAAKAANIRLALNARREALADLSDLATSLLQDAGHNPSLDVIRRITTTLEAMSVYASRSDAPRPGRLTHDVDPPGFDALSSWITSAATTHPKDQPARIAPSPRSSPAVTNIRRKVATEDGVQRVDDKRKAKIAAAKISLQDAKRLLTEARARTKNLEGAQKKADAEARKAEQQWRGAEAELRNAKAASEKAERHARTVAGEVEEAATALNDAERTFEEASKELESLSGESSGR